MDSCRVVWEKPISKGNHFSIVHRNSIFGSWVWEAFVIDPQGVIWLEKIKTDHPAVLEYYGLEHSTTDWIRLPRKLGRIPLRITRLGETRLEWREEILFLSALVPDGAFIEIQTSGQSWTEGIGNETDLPLAAD